MSRARGGLLVVVAASALVGCAPSAQQLVAGRHYREALCVAEREPAHRALVDTALRDDLDAQVEMSVVDVPASERVNGARWVLRVRVATGALPVDDLAVRVAPTSDAMVPTELTTLAAFTGEKLPETRVTPPTGAAQLVNSLTEILTLGIIRPNLDTGPTMYYPSQGEIRQAAPHAAALFERFPSACERAGESGTGRRCVHQLVVREVDAPVAIDVSLVVGGRPSPERREHCEQTLTTRVPLGQARELMATTERTFGGRFRRLSQVPALR